MQPEYGSGSGGYGAVGKLFPMYSLLNTVLFVLLGGAGEELSELAPPMCSKVCEGELAKPCVD